MSANDPNRERRLALKKQFLQRAIEEGRGPQAIALLNQFARHSIRHADQEAERARIHVLDEYNDGQPRSIRALNIIQHMEGSSTMYRASHTDYQNKATATTYKYSRTFDEHMQIGLN
jgi:hypothetical protein